MLLQFNDLLENVNLTEKYSFSLIFVPFMQYAG